MGMAGIFSPTTDGTSKILLDLSGVENGLFTSLSFIQYF